MTGIVAAASFDIAFRRTVKHAAVGALLGILLPIATWAEDSWVRDQTVQRQLAARQVAVQIAFDGDQSLIHVHAAVRVNASPEAVWRVLTDCEHAASFIPGVRWCHRVAAAPDDSWEIIEQEAKYSWLMPPVTCVIRAAYQRPRRIDFKRVSGDLKSEEGTWLLVGPTGDTAASGPTLVEYELSVDPGFWIPRILLRHSLGTELPAALAAVRERSESTAEAR